MNQDTMTCPHCGKETGLKENPWQDLAQDQTTCPVCSHCNELLTEKSVEKFVEQLVNNPDAAQDIQLETASGKKRSGKNTGWIRFFIFMGIMICLIIWLNKTFGNGSLKDNAGQIIYQLLLLAFISASFSFRGQGKMVLKYMAIWGSIFLIALIGYSFRAELGSIKDRVISTLVPEFGMASQKGAMSFQIASDGHFYIRARINGMPIRFLADTGASSIVLTLHDAKRLGIDTEHLIFDRFYETANGRGRGASVRLPNMAVGTLQLESIGASVNEAPMDTSLLGMSFFKRLSSYDVKNNVLTIRWETR